jgi:hypothetical protein
MAALVLDDPTAVAESTDQTRLESEAEAEEHWLVFQYSPVALFSLKMSRATSTAGKTLLIPTPYAAKMAFVDACLRHNLTRDPDTLVRSLAKAIVRIGVPQHACVTGTIQSIRQEIRDVERKRIPSGRLIAPTLQCASSSIVKARCGWRLISIVAREILWRYCLRPLQR